MTAYTTYAQFTQVYSVRNVSQADVESAWIPKAAAELNMRLGAFFTTPFSSNNETAKWLNIDLTYANLLRKTLKQDDSLELDRRIDKEIEDITEGNTPMILADGTALFASGGGSQGFWSPTQGFKSVFDMRDAEEQRVNPDLRQDLFDQDV